MTGKPGTDLTEVRGVKTRADTISPRPVRGWGLLMSLGASGLLGLGACQGQIGTSADISGSPGGTGSSSGSGGSGSSSGAPNGTVATQCVAGASLAPARAVLLKDEQYVNVVRDVLGVQFAGDVTASKNISGVYGSNDDLRVTPDIARAYLRAADQVGAAVKPCGTAQPDAVCMEQFLRAKLPLVWRTSANDPAIGDSVTKLMGIFNAALPDGAAGAVNLVMEAMLGSGSFLYLTEVGANAATATGTTPLTPYELANALSFTLYNSAPDATLRAKADNGTLAQNLGAEVDRLMGLQATQANLTTKVSYYVSLEKLSPPVQQAQTYPKADPAYTPSLQAALYTSGQMFLNDIVVNGKFSDLFTSHRVYANKEMATVYNIAGPTGANFVPVDIPTDDRGAGILTQPGILAVANAHPDDDDIVHRGLYLYDTFACGVPLGTPPADATAKFAMIMAPTARGKALVRDSMPECMGCHNAFDPFGLASESYDPIGRYRTADALGNAIDNTATIQNLGPDIDGPITSINDIAKRFAQGRRASDCAADTLARFTLNHDPSAENSCDLQGVKDTFAKSGSLLGFFKSLVTSPAFAIRDLTAKK